MLELKELKERLSRKYSKSILKNSIEKRIFNIKAFNDISRDGLCYSKTERRLHLFSTAKEEQVYIQLPGKESIEVPPMELDFRPKIMINTGKVANDFTFGQIWDVFESIGKKYNDSLSFIAAIIYDMGYLQGYEKENDIYDYEDVSVTSENEEVVASGQMKFEWYRIGVDDDMWRSLNDRIGDIELPEGNMRVSLEAFLKMVDLLFQNEDCKYYYKNVVLEDEEKKKQKYEKDLKNGRISSAHSNLFMLNYLQGNDSISRLVNAFQKGRGVAGFKKSLYSQVTKGIIANEDSI